MWFRNRKKEDESRLEKASELDVEAQKKLERSDDLVDRVVHKVRELKEQERINRLAPVIMEAVRRRHG